MPNASCLMPHASCLHAPNDNLSMHGCAYATTLRSKVLAGWHWHAHVQDCDYNYECIYRQRMEDSSWRTYVFRATVRTECNNCAYASAGGPDSTVEYSRKGSAEAKLCCLYYCTTQQLVKIRLVSKQDPLALSHQPSAAPSHQGAKQIKASQPAHNRHSQLQSPSNIAFAFSSLLHVC